MENESARMIVLGIESSCDETAAAVVELKDGVIIERSHALISQMDMHTVYGGVVPEIAARSHIEVINPLIEKAVADSGYGWGDIDAIGVTKGPGLSGSLLVGTLAARALAVLKDKPLYGVNHVLGHVYANFVLPDAANDNWKTPEFPMLALIVSGGHTQLVIFHDHFDYTILGRTGDDAAGEAFDKVAKMLGLPYPGGPSVAEAAKKGESTKYAYPRPKTEEPYDFSFSGLKTAVLRHLQKLCGKDYRFASFKLKELLSESQINDVAASFQATTVDILVGKTLKAASEFSPKSIVIAGGVAANEQLRSRLSQELSDYEVAYAPNRLCTDNGVMIAALAAFEASKREPDDPSKLAIFPNLSM